MCGRFIRTSPLDQIIAELGIDLSRVDSLSPRYNVCPGESILAAIAHETERRLGWLHWGIPSTSPGASGLINARAETIAIRPSFRDAFRRRRCLIVADGFYEWKRETSGKQPWLIRPRESSPITFAGIWSPAPTNPPSACAIVTCAPNELVEPIHDRMPVILPPDARATWLDASAPSEVLSALLRPFPSDGLEALPVSARVGSPRNDGPDLIAPLTAPPPSDERP